MSIPLPVGSLSVAITMPSGWTITSTNGGKLLTGDGVHSGTWVATSSPFEVTVVGMSGTTGTMKVTINGTIHRSYSLP